MSIHKTEALVLRKRDFRETSIIAEFFTRDYGKINGILKGIRNTPGKFASDIEPFSHNEIIFYKSRSSSLHLVSQADKKNHFAPIRQHIVKTGMSGFMMELIGAVMQEEDKNEEVFDLGLNCLSELSLTSNPEKVMTIFKIKMLSLSGFKPHFDSCVSCSQKVSGQAKFSLMLGGLLCPKCSHKDSSCRMIFRGTIASILHIERNDFRSNLNLGLNPQIKKELDMILNAFLNFHLERELKSQKVLNKLENFSLAVK
ncbi:MAG: DNA repair protein RecO [Candidatus Omnitrophica bacterium]|nr:DNA repair protein RecO [Candidatus Omnitrophota bacterium]